MWLGRVMIFFEENGFKTFKSRPNTSGHSSLSNVDWSRVAKFMRDVLNGARHSKL